MKAKAYVLTGYPDIGEERAELVFAESARKARRLAHEITEIETVKRDATLDHLKDASPRDLTRGLLAAGWGWDDEDCVRRFADDDPFVAMDGSVYSSWMAWLDERVERIQREAAKAEIFAAAEAETLRRYPFATVPVCNTFGSSEALEYILIGERRFTMRSAVACRFAWPGGKHGGAMLWFGSGEPYLTLPAGDVRAWYAYLGEEVPPDVAEKIAWLDRLPAGSVEVGKP